eukprot:4344084-Pleurochrysis_carterae.AAC.2
MPGRCTYTCTRLHVPCTSTRASVLQSSGHCGARTCEIVGRSTALWCHALRSRPSHACGIVRGVRGRSPLSTRSCALSQIGGDISACAIAEAKNVNLKRRRMSGGCC